jgi:hypothetical protein
MTTVNRTRLILDLLRARHDARGNGLARQWVYAEEVRMNTGFGPDTSLPLSHPVRVGWEQRIDAYAMHTWPSAQYRRIAYEVKVTRSDLRRELEQPGKQDAALAVSNLLYLVLDHDIRYDDLPVPITWGIMQLRYPQPTLGDASAAVDDTRAKLVTVRKAQRRDTDHPGFGFMLSLARNLQGPIRTIEAAKVEHR